MSRFKYFPYEPRPFQEETMRKITRYIKMGAVCLHAPTGFGKTPVILSVLLPFIKRGLKVIWAVRTGNETDRPIEELKIIVEKMGLDILALSYRGKKDMCLLSRRYGELDYSEVSYLCSQKRRECPYYVNFLENFDYSIFREHSPLLYSDIYGIAEKEEICPYYAQRALLEIADLVALSYNYVVDSRLEWSIRRLFPYNRAILVVDEAHNLQNIELNSEHITLGTVRRALREAEEWDAPAIADFVFDLRDKVDKLFRALADEEDIAFTPSEFIAPTEYDLLDRAKALGEFIRRKMLEEGKRPRSSLYRLAIFWKKALELEGLEGIAFIAEKERDNLRLNIWDMRSAEILASRWPIFKRCIFCSGTLEPIEAFAEVIGLDDYYSIKVPPIYDPKNLRIYILNDVSTKGEELSEKMATRYVEAIVNFLKKVNVNSAIFTASYRVQERLIRIGLKEEVKGLGYSVFEESRGMTGLKARQILESFKKFRKAVLIAPMGGRFAEGADFPGEQLQAIFLVGIPFEKPTTRTQLYLDYYSKLYGKEKGRLYGYTIPALKRAAQALGRALRSPDDKAVFVLGDKRYKKYIDLLPEYVKEWSREISVEDIEDISTPW